MSDLISDLINEVLPCAIGGLYGGVIGLGLGGPVGAAAGAALGCAGLYTVTKVGTGQPLLPAKNTKQNEQVKGVATTATLNINEILNAILAMQMMPVILDMIQNAFKPPSPTEKLMQHLLNFVPLVLLALVL